MTGHASLKELLEMKRGIQRQLLVLRGDALRAAERELRDLNDSIAEMTKIVVPPSARRFGGLRRLRTKDRRRGRSDWSYPRRRESRVKSQRRRRGKQRS